MYNDTNYLSVVQKPELPTHKVDDQKVVDGALAKSIGSVPDMEGYLKTLFSLKSGEYPHKMKF